MTRSWTFTISELGRPLLANAAKKMHPKDETRARGQWRDAATVLALAAGIPKRLASIDVTVQARYRTRQGSDCDAPAPTVKGVIDGLKNAGIILDDKPPYVASVCYIAPQVGTGLPDALIVAVSEHEGPQP